MNWFVQGGWPMYPILVCSIIALAAVIERTVVFILTAENLNRILRTAREGGFIRGRGLCSTALAVYAAENSLSRGKFEEQLHAAVTRVIQALNRRVGLLAVIAHLTPLMGLLGTVIGMIGVFQGLQAGQGRAEISALAGGIWVALLTTAFGLAVAIPSFAAHHLFDAIIRRRTENLEAILPELNRIYNRDVSIDSCDETSSQEVETLHEDVYST
jgi:biopolymer transport protein ExbB